MVHGLHQIGEPGGGVNRQPADATQVGGANPDFLDQWEILSRPLVEVETLRPQDPSQPRSKRSARAVRRPSFILWGAGADDQMK